MNDVGVFGVGEIREIRAMHRSGRTVAQIGARWVRFSRQQIIEAIDAIRRHASDWNAVDHVNRVLDMQAQQIPLINGWPANDVLDGIDMAFRAPSHGTPWADKNSSPLL